jgi:hypothetical protein
VGDLRRDRADLAQNGTRLEVIDAALPGATGVRAYLRRAVEEDGRKAPCCTVLNAAFANRAEATPLDLLDLIVGASAGTETCSSTFDEQNGTVTSTYWSLMFSNG